MSPCSSDFIISEDFGAWRKVSEDSGGDRSFLLIDCTERFVTAAFVDVVGGEYLQILSVSSI
jgi:hypothetical protein